jgi:hypothetical protein
MKTTRYKATFAGGAVHERHSKASYTVAWRVTGYGKHTGRKYEAHGFSVNEERARRTAGYELDMMRPNATLEIVAVEIIPGMTRGRPIKETKTVIDDEAKSQALEQFDSIMNTPTAFYHPTYPLSVMTAEHLGGNPTKWVAQLTVKGGKERLYLISREGSWKQRHRSGRVLMYGSAGAAAYAALEARENLERWHIRISRKARAARRGSPPDSQE